MKIGKRIIGNKFTGDILLELSQYQGDTFLENL